MSGVTYGGGGDAAMSTAVSITDYDKAAPSGGHNAHCYLAILRVWVSKVQSESKNPASVSYRLGLHRPHRPRRRLPDFRTLTFLYAGVWYPKHL